MKRPTLNRALVLETPVRASDGAGGFVESWQPLGNLWADVQPRSGREGAGEGGPQSIIRFRITVRAAPAGAESRPVAGQRFRMSERIFQILSVSEIEPDARHLLCETREEVTA